MTERTGILERRAVYRHEPPPVLEPMLSILHDGRRAVASAVIDVTLTGMRVEFDDSQAVRFVPPEDVILSVQSPGLDGYVSIAARIAFSDYTSERNVVGLEIIDTPELSERVTSTFFSIFNRRGKIRETVTHGKSDILAYLLDSANDSSVAATLEVGVVNYSPMGIGFLAGAETDSVLRDRASASLALKLSEEDEFATFPVRICHRAAQSDAVYYGCLFQEAAG